MALLLSGLKLRMPLMIICDPAIGGPQHEHGIYFEAGLIWLCAVPAMLLHKGCAGSHLVHGAHLGNGGAHTAPGSLCLCFTSWIGDEEEPNGWAQQ